MTVLDSYLDTLFAPYPSTPRLREARSELHAMMEDKRSALVAGGATEAQAVGQVIAEFGSLDEVADVLGIQPEVRAADASAASPLPVLELPRAQQFIGAARRHQRLLAAAIPLFVLASAPLLTIIGLARPMDDDSMPWPIVLGLTLLLALVAAGAAMLVVRSRSLDSYEDLTEERFRPSPEVRAYANDGLARQRPTATGGLVVAIILWILSAVPIFVFGAVFQDSGSSILGVVLTLVMVAIGLGVQLWTSGATEQLALLRDGGRPPEDDVYRSKHPAIRLIAALYWPTTLAVYLGWSFIGNAWTSSWIIWPLAGVLFGGLAMVNKALSPEEPRADLPAAR